jgi:hypothetical protein
LSSGEYLHPLPEFDDILLNNATGTSQKFICNISSHAEEIKSIQKLLYPSGMYFFSLDVVIFVGTASVSSLRFQLFCGELA